MKQDLSLTMPAVLQTLQSEPKDAEALMRELPKEAVEAFQAMRLAGFRAPGGMLSAEAWALIARLNESIGSLHAFVRNKPWVEARAEAYHAEVHASRSKAAVMRGLAAPEKAAPPLMKQAKNFLKAIVSEGKAVAKKEPPVSTQEKEIRLAFCLAPCPELIGEGTASPRCAQCGCYVRRKTTWRSQSCPLGKW